MGGGEGVVVNDKCSYSRNIKSLLTYLPTYLLSFIYRLIVNDCQKTAFLIAEMTITECKFKAFLIAIVSIWQSKTQLLVI